jgi:hypothetical protein
MKLFGPFSISYALLTSLYLAAPAPDPNAKGLSLPDLEVDSRAPHGEKVGPPAQRQ